MIEVQVGEYTGEDDIVRIEDGVTDKFMWLLQHFSSREITIVGLEEGGADDDYLRSIEGMVDSIKQAKAEPLSQGVSLQQLDW